LLFVPFWLPELWLRDVESSNILEHEHPTQFLNLFTWLC